MLDGFLERDCIWMFRCWLYLHVGFLLFCGWNFEWNNVCGCLPVGFEDYCWIRMVGLIWVKIGGMGLVGRWWLINWEKWWLVVERNRGMVWFWSFRGHWMTIWVGNRDMVLRWLTELICWWDGFLELWELNELIEFKKLEQCFVRIGWKWV